MPYNHDLVNDMRCFCDESADNDQLIKLAIVGDAAAKEALIVNNYRLVITIVEQYIKSFPGYSYLRDDLTAEGLHKLTELVDRLREKEPNNFVAHLCTSIRNRLSDFVNEEIQDISVEPDLLPDKSDDCPDELIEWVMSCCSRKNNPLSIYGFVEIRNVRYLTD